MRTSDFDYHLPEELIAQEPLADRSASRLLVVHRDTGRIEHRRFTDILEYLRPGDVLVVNNTRVSAFRLRGKRPTGAAVEALITDRREDGLFRALMKPGRRLRAGDEVWFSDNLQGVVVERLDDGSRLLRLQTSDSQLLDFAIGEAAETPLPPYIKVPLKAGDRYQTVYSATDGSSAAPTAGLHFTGELLARARDSGVVVAEITLHIGASTFRPVRAEHLEDHRIAGEYISVSPKTAETVNSAKGRIIAVGTTSTRALESVASARGRIEAFEGETELFIKPGFEFRVVSGLITNFHMPRSTLFVLVCAFAGREMALEAYREAVERGYRFLSLGDAMYIV